jgi:hypothetical protein
VSRVSPKPWAAECADGSVKIVCATGGVVALMKAASGRKLANAQLISAAPEMLELLEMIGAKLRGERDTPWLGLSITLSKVLDKAKGEPC